MPCRQLVFLSSEFQERSQPASLRTPLLTMNIPIPKTWATPRKVAYVEKVWFETHLKAVNPSRRLQKVLKLQSIDQRKGFRFIKRLQLRANQNALRPRLMKSDTTNPGLNIVSVFFFELYARRASLGWKLV